MTDDGKTPKVRVAPDGTYEGVDPLTGDVVWVEKVKGRTSGPQKRTGGKNGRPRREVMESKLHQVMGPDGKLHWLPKGVGPDTLPHTVWDFHASGTLIDTMMVKIADGATLRQIGLIVGFPPIGILQRWLTDYPDFKRRYRDAIALRAEYHREKMLDSANDADAKSAPAERLRMEAHKWLAEVDDPETYGKRTKVVGDPNAPLGFMVVTGVPDAEHEVESQVSSPAIPSLQEDK